MPTPTSAAVIELLARGGIEAAGWYLDRDYDDAEIFRRLKNRYPDAPYQAVRSVLDRAEDAQRAGEILSGPMGESGLYGGDVPLDPTGGEPGGTGGGRYKYRGTYEYRSPRTERTRKWFFEFDSDENLTREEAEQRARSEYIQDSSSDPRYLIPDDELGDRWLGASFSRVTRRY